MTETYIMDVRQLEEESIFRSAFDMVSPYRRQKIAMLKQEKDKNRSLGAALALNAALKKYNLEERSMEYDLEKQGKPVFHDYPELHFSLSHSGDYAICSIGGCEIGNDIERVRSGKERLAQRFFAKEEFAWIQEAASMEEREERMFRIWTMKESFLKVTGFGMSLPLNDFAIIMEKNGKIHLQQHVDGKTYFIKEYALPDKYRENTGYKISVCCENSDFAPDINPVFLSFCNLFP